MIRLTSIDPARNRFRYYEIHFEATLFGVEVTVVWGRIRHTRRRRVLVFDHEEEAARVIQRLLKRRRYHGYRPEGDPDRWAYLPKGVAWEPR